MNVSCNGCRVLRKGCSPNCTLRACIQWIKSPQSQANATLFLSKFYGRAGLLHLLNSGPAHLRPEIFKSLLHEACGRIINPISGSAGLMCTAEWPRCQAAVEAVLRGAPLMKLQVPGAGDSDDSSVREECPILPLQGCDIRHVSKDAADSLRRVRARNRSKRSSDQVDSVPAEFLIEPETKFTITGWGCSELKNFVEPESHRAPSHDSGSVETAEPSQVDWYKETARGGGLEPEPRRRCEMGLELTLSLDPVRRTAY